MEKDNAMTKFIVKRTLGGWWTNTVVIEANNEKQAIEKAKSIGLDAGPPNWEEGTFHEDDSGADYVIDSI